MKIYVINGPNLNMLGIREKEIYGSRSLQDLENMILDYTNKNNIEVEFFQSNYEGAIIDKIQEAFFKKIDGIVINPGAYAHYSYAILDAITSSHVKTVEVHISDINVRESFRQLSVTSKAAIKMICGHGFNGYLEAINLLKKENE